jgi:hypothetical protein
VCVDIKFNFKIPSKKFHFTAEAISIFVDCENVADGVISIFVDCENVADGVVSVSVGCEDNSGRSCIKKKLRSNKLGEGKKNE